MKSNIAPRHAAAAASTAIPAEWARHKALWIGFPSHAREWLEDLEPAQAEVAGLINVLSDTEPMRVLVDGGQALTAARKLIKAPAEIIPARLGDIWLRDTGPIFGFEVSRFRGFEDKKNSSQPRNPAAHLFRFNGWGGKYIMAGDEGVNETIAGLSGATPRRHDFILEGGSLDMDGEGACLTTRQCLLNKNRNSDYPGGWDQQKAESALKEALGLTHILWLDEGLAGDHTDGHIDNIARFVAPGKVVCQSPSGADDPNAAVLKNIEKALGSMRDAAGRKLEIIAIPSPGRVENQEGELMTASHMNFIIANGHVAVPAYNDRAGDAVAALAKLFPSRKVIALSARAVLTGGGAFHCITQQEPE